jgi:probable phosphoglycerate mutase
MTQLILIRHGQTLWNEQRRMQGQSDSPLTETGVRQSRLLGHRLAHMQFTALYSSDTGRAHHTARNVAEITGHPVIVDSRLRERHFGVFEGLNGEEIQARYPEAYARFKNRDVAYVIPGGESTLAFRERALHCLNEIAARHAGESIVVITHGLVLDVIYRTAVGIPFEQRRTYDLVNAGINRFRYDAGAWHLEVWADGSHLNDGLITTT